MKRSSAALAALVLTTIPLTSTVSADLIPVRHHALITGTEVKSLTDTIGDNALDPREPSRILTLKELPNLIRNSGVYACFKDENNCRCFQVTVSESQITFNPLDDDVTIPKGAILILG
jgi:hypothetical protein